MTHPRAQFIVDRNGRKKAVILAFREYANLMEDMADLAVTAERRLEKKISHKDFLAGLKKDGLL